MKKLNTPSKAYIITTTVFWLVFVLLVVFNRVLVPLFELDKQPDILQNTFPHFIGIFFLLGLFVALVLMLTFASNLLINSKFASMQNYKAEGRWAANVFAFNLIFTIIFVSWFTLQVLFTIGSESYKNPVSDANPSILDANQVLISFCRSLMADKPGIAVIIGNGDISPQQYNVVYSIKISTVVNFVAIFGVFSSVLSYSLAIAISQRSANAAWKEKEFERVEIY